ncbi:MAG: non-canonical purine NTP pyrophosphatase [Acidobacteriota bacterium]|nr:non-canonical purine NTP pyrophosphatase [Acidobacteriota bacterium]MDH3525159.1 non-canonical purine NTP pyrophosphatase [Acidobacteriota bacterium]
MSSQTPLYLPPFVLVTGNSGKLAETRRLLGRRIESITVELPEIQSLDLAAVLRAKADEAARHTDAAFAVEETALELDALNGFPGPLVKWMLDAIGAEGIARVALAAGNARARARCRLLLRAAGRDLEAEGVTEGTLVLPPRGDQGFGWDPVFLPAGETRTYGELPAADKDRLGHRGRAWRQLLATFATAADRGEPG